MAHYALKLEPDDDGSILVTSPALEEVTTFGADRAEALTQGLRAVEEALAARMAGGRDIPRPCVMMAPGQAVARVDLGTEAKIELYRALRQRGLTRADLTRRLGWHRPQVDRLFNLNHRSRADQLSAAFEALGVEVGLQTAETAG